MATRTINGSTGPDRGSKEADSIPSAQGLASQGDPAPDDLPAFALANLGDIFRRQVGLKRASVQTRALYATLKTLENQ